MILFSRTRRAFAKITGREWALLSLETLGVVAGILIAFELNEWAARRNDAARHSRLMERLFEEAQWDVAALRNLRDLMRSQVRAETAFATVISNGKCPAEQHWTATGTVGRYPAIEAPRSVYRELMGAGGLSTIKDPIVRREIAIFHTSLDQAQSQMDFFRATRTIPVPADDPRISFKYDASNVEEPAIATFEREALCRDSGFKNRMIVATRAHHVALSYYETVAENAIYMCANLGESLGRQCRPGYGAPLAKDDVKTLQKAIADRRTAKD